ncbi:hypothetical protein Ana3638_14970 [Anaerocolumna sedimenticola]|uniref:O-antigen ligase-related domain-containing protein n=1 Tax=Anaerocolumna sedimenticola TaxID=2696063 RepID=A0A6P1TQV8_9FIRM|nr:O-antigen ligase family protein [Anaerocolumna sedimenticola]QHQ61925.1 hypothetical protein Ana3638_14970 [Anaerocolumna sedimenticola]
MRPKKKRKEFNDLLIPIIFLLSIHPFITRLIVYESGLAKYKWFPDNDIVSDFFSYYKSYGLILVAVFAAIILLIYLLLYRSRMKNMKLFIPLGIYSLIIILSAAFSVDVHTSLVGGMAHFESVFVLLGYGVSALYTYQIMKSEEDFKSVLKSMIISSIVMIILGFLQMLGKDIIEFTWFQKLIIPRDYWEEYLGNIKNLLSTNAVSLTLFNPNYASVYVAMLIPVFMVRMLSVDNKKKKVSYIILLCAMLTVQFKTYSRTGFLSIFITILFMGYFYRDRLKQWKKQCTAGLILCFVLFIAVDSLSGFRFITKLNDTFKNVNKTEGNSLEEILTNKEQVSISYKGVKLQVAIDSSQGSLAFTDVSGEDKTGLYNKNTNTLELEPFQDIKFMIKNDNGKELLIARINGTDWNFYNDKEQGYIYLNDFGKTEKLEKIDTLGFKNQEHIASGRGYIWSRSIPLLKKNPLTGTGPDTFLLVFPQWDHVGKANNCKTPYTLIEKPHNMYLMIGIQTGVISLLLFLLFYILYFIQSFRIYRKITGNGYIKQLGLGCFLATISYMVSGLFNDSSLQTSPTFWILIGMGLAANYQLRQGSKIGTK